MPFWYERQKPLLGDEFKKAIDDRISLIEKFPERFPERRKYFRELQLKKFPFIIVYLKKE